jgi:diguanylate cyclase (GGDEF)-like protein
MPRRTLYELNDPWRARSVRGRGDAGRPSQRGAGGRRKSLPRRLTCAIATILALVSTAWASGPATLNSLHAVHALSNADANHRIHAIFEATVVYSRGYERLLFVQDGDEALFVAPPTVAPFLPGDRILITGDTQASFRPLVIASDVTLLHHGALPRPVPARFAELIRGQHDCRLVTVRATVRAADQIASVNAARRSSQLQLLMEGGHIEANLDADDEWDLIELLDDDVEITGVAAGKFDNKMQQTGVVLYVSSIANVKTVKHVDSPQWSLPVTPMDKILAGYNVQDLTQRVKVRGTITYYQPGTAVVLQDGSRSLWITTHTRKPLRIGDVAEAIGFPDAHDRILNLSDGEIQDTGVFAPVKPKQASWEQLAFWSSNRPDGHQNDLVSIDGELLTEVREATQDEYVVVSDGRLFTSIYRHPRANGVAPSMRQVPTGSKVRITGICTVLDTNSAIPGQEVPFNILLRSFDDISQLARPSLLNVRNLIILIGLLLLLLLAVGGRSWLIERKVRRQNACVAYIERKRARILEEINGSRPLAEIIEQITELVSYKLDGAPSWCEIVDGAQLGNWPSQLSSFRVVSEPIAARSGPPLGTISVAFDPRKKQEATESATLVAAAGLTTLAIETRRLYSDLRHRSEFDLLTDIHNRFSLETYVDRQIEEARQNARIFGLIYIDLNDFKQVNDVYGHQIGDLYLQEAANRMKRQLRGVDMLARLGGDEFAVVLPMVHNPAEVEEIAHRLERSFDAPFTFEGRVLHGSASVGIALYPEHGTTRDSLLSSADAAMYVVKQTKKHRDPLSSANRDPEVVRKDRTVPS